MFITIILLISTHHEFVSLALETLGIWSTETKKRKIFPTGW